MMQAYLENKTEGRNIGLLVTFLMACSCALGLLVAAMVAWGWMPLGERANIPRWSEGLNSYEQIVTVASLIYALCAGRTTFGLISRERASLRWSQWMFFISIVIGGAILLSVIIPVGLKFALLLGQNIDLRAQISEEVGGLVPTVLSIGEGLISISLLVLVLIALLALFVFIIPPLESLRRMEGVRLIVAPPRRLIQAILIVFALGIICVLIAGIYAVPLHLDKTKIRIAEDHRILAGLLFFLPALFGYLQVRQMREESDELRRAVALTPGKFIRSELAKSPSAGAIIGFIAIFLTFTMATDLFLEPSSIASYLSNVATKGVIAIGVTYLMISGEFDLSVGSILGVTALSFMLFMTEGAPVLGVLDPIPAAILAIFVAMVLGAVNGVLLITTRIPSFIVTLGTLLAYRAITLVAIAGGRILRYRDFHDEFPVFAISNIVFVALAVIGLALIAFTAYRVLPALFRGVNQAWSIRTENGDFGTSGAIIRFIVFLVVLLILLAVVAWLVAVFGYHIGGGGGQLVEVGYFDLFNGRVASIGSEGDFFHLQIPRDANVRLAILWWFIFVVIFHIILTSTSFGNSVFAAGGNEGAARAQGVNVDRVKVQNFVIVAALTGIAAIYETARNPGVDPLKGQGWELEVIAMTVIGGALLTGGYGSVVGSMLGALIFGMLQTGLVLVGIESRLFSGTVGVIIIAAVVLNTFVRGAQRN
ncbi:MAG: ABC transporter permease [Chloroflexi bacterium]|nr:ABC transporter permease [Chloroflexota bacterium]